MKLKKHYTQSRVLQPSVAKSIANKNANKQYD